MMWSIQVKIKQLWKKYSPRSVKTGKLENKLALQRQVGLPEDSEVALIGIVTRLTEQKGLDLIINQFEAMCQRRVQIIILGSGDRMYEDALKGVAWEHQDKVSFQCKYDFVLSNRIYAGCDMFLNAFTVWTMWFITNDVIKNMEQFLLLEKQVV